jgi:hypothetical protein
MFLEGGGDGSVEDGEGSGRDGKGGIERSVLPRSPSSMEGEGSAPAVHVVGISSPPLFHPLICFF